MAILVTGAAGYVGSHTTSRLLRAGRTVIGLDNYSTGLRRRADHLAALAVNLPGTFHIIEGDVADTALVTPLMREHEIDAVVHMAAHCVVGESVRAPEKYWRNNVGATGALLASCAQVGVRRFVLSSTTAVYGDPMDRLPSPTAPIPEDTPCRPVNPYGETKLECERMLWTHAEQMEGLSKTFACAALRYFNVAGCDPDLGEQSTEAGRLIPAAIEVALGRRETLTVYGSDFPTPDGTAIRDYVDVRDVADAHLAVLDALQPGDRRLYNIGMGRGWSVREVAEATARATGRDIPITEASQREGDPPALVADVKKIARELGWQATRTNLDEIIRSAWITVSMNTA